jgi:1-aminocyclopropane-1-carboxylate deaminase/D-cysteine desulfhydrase-like pyridoxal-dependent ACC family enzyme
MEPLGPKELTERLEQFPRVHLGYYPTPLESWLRIGQCLNRPATLYAKREDLSGLAFGGNKVRQLEFLLGDALAQGADVIVHGAAVQSNYCRTLAAASGKLGLQCHLVLSRVYGQPENQGNFLLDRIAGASIELVDIPLGPGLEARKQQAVERLKAAGRKPYLISYPRSEVLGTASFVVAAAELYQQCLRLPSLPNYLVTAAVGATQAGLLLGARLLGWNAQVLGFAPLKHGEYSIRETEWSCIREVAERLGTEPRLQQNEIVSVVDYVGPGYAQITPDCVSAIALLARTEGVFLDPVYTGKAMAGLLDYLRKKKIPPDEDIVFVHTGGNTALFAYADSVLQLLERSTNE